MKLSDMLIIAVALGGAVWLAKKHNVADFYGTRPGSQQSNMLAAQDDGFLNTLWSPQSTARETAPVEWI